MNKVKYMLFSMLALAMMALPAIRDVRRHFAGRPIAIASRPSIAPVFRAVPDVDRGAEEGVHGGAGRGAGELEVPMPSRGR